MTPRLEVTGRWSVMTVADRRAEGLDHWTDGTFGEVRVGDRIVTLAPNGPVTARHSRPVDDADPRGGPWPGRLDDPAIVIAGLPAHVNHASGGPAYHDADRDQVLLWYHGEVHHEADATLYYSFVGLAVSTDGGSSFRDLGPIVEPSISLELWRMIPFALEVGPGGIVVVGSWFHTYYQDVGTQGRVNLGVARAPVADVLAAAARGEAATWTKFHDGAFSEPALAGRSTDVLPSRTSVTGVRWFDVAWHRPTRSVMLVYSAHVLTRWRRYAVFSSDGVAFGPPVLIDAELTLDEVLYLTVAPLHPGTGQREIDGPEFLLYSVRSGRGGFDRWRDAEIEVVRVAVS